MILFHDVDGCLNAEDGEGLPMDSSAFTPAQQSRLGELGQLLDRSPVSWLAINTGRALSDTETLVPMISSTKLRFLIAEHGAVIIDLHKNCSLEWTGDAAEKLADIRQLINWFDEGGLARFGERVRHELSALQKASNLTIAIPSTVDSDWIYGELQAFVETESPFDPEDFVFHHGKADGFMDIMSTLDKGDGVQRIMALTEAQKAIAVGNGINDIPMMVSADLCICPANSEPELINIVRQRDGIFARSSYIHATLDWLRELHKKDYP